jgi:lincosamide nucleotidyltransferase
MLICDRTGELMAHLRYISGPGPDRMTAETAQHLWHSLLNWILFGANVLGRGERARALELLWFVQRHLLSMARLVEGSTAHWFPPVRYLEHDVSSASYQRYIACTASLRGDELEQAYANAWAWSKELARALVDRFELNLHERLIDRLDHRFTTP